MKASNTSVMTTFGLRKIYDRIPFLAQSIILLVFMVSMVLAIGTAIRSPWPLVFQASYEDRPCVAIKRCPVLCGKLMNPVEMR